MKAVLKAIEDDIANSKRLLEATQKMVNDAPGAMQSHSDTSRFQMSILAGRQDEFLFEKQKALRGLQAFVSTIGTSQCSEIKTGSVFTIKDGVDQNHYLLLPFGGGQEVDFEECKYCILTPKSPLTGQLLDKKKGDKVRLTIGGVRTVEIIELA